MSANEQMDVWLDKLASEAPAPGGGAAAALSLSMGASLISMGCNLTIGKKKYAAYEATMKSALERAEQARRVASGLAEEDAKAFDSVIAAYQLPKDSAEDKAARSAAIQSATIEAAGVPMRTAELAAEMIALAGEIVEGANKNVISDVALSVLMSKAALEGSVVNVEINLGTIADEAKREQLEQALARCQQALPEADEISARVRKQIGGVLIRGAKFARAIKKDSKARIAALADKGVTPTMAVVMPTDDEATAWYVNSIVRAASKAGIECRVDKLAEATKASICARLDELSADASVHGIICQTPLPAGVKLTDVAPHIAVAKDIDGANPESLGRLASGLPAFPPATSEAVVEILRRAEVPLSGATVTVVGRSNVVGKPAALLLTAENATVRICHSRTRDLAAACREADVVVAAVGRAKLIGAEHVREGAIVIDVGTNPTEDGGLVGDVDQAAVESKVAGVTPVPGGVGPVTTALLLRHVVDAAEAASA